MLLALLLVATQLAAPSQPTGEILVEIRVHGNYATPEQTVLSLAGLALNQPFSDQLLQEAQQRLIASGRFERVQVLKRFRSIDDPNQILAVILVDERPGAQPDGTLPGPLGRLLGQSMWAPVLGFEDGYGFTYGARLSLVDAIGPRSRVSFPLTWGGERQAAVEVERTFDGPIVSRVFGAVAVRRRENPFFEIGDTRQSASIGVDRAITPWLTATATGRVAHVDFDDLAESHRAIGGRITFDTRRDPTFPRNAIYAQTGLERIAFDGRADATRWTTDMRGYVGLIGPAVLALTAAVDRASAPLPPYEQRLLGGAASLRGYRAGFDAGDSVAIASAELRVPLTSPLSVGRLGVKAFTDLGTVWNHGERLVDRQWWRGIGGGAFLTITALTAGLDVAWNESGHARWHVTLGVKF